MGRRSILAGLLVVAFTAYFADPASPTSSTRPIATASPCGVPTTATHYDHVVWILLENVGYSVVGSSEAPHLNALAAACGLATRDFAVSHPSLPNYLALTSGSSHGITDDGEPSEHPLSGPSIFSELHGNWRSLEESMPTPCDRVTSGAYAARHNPAVYYLSLGAACERDDLPLTWPLALRAGFTLITPNVCHDMHSCPITDGDAWLARAVTAIVTSPQYQSRSLVLFITIDENTAGTTNRIPTYVVAPSVPRGLKVSTPFDHYSLLRTTESLLGLPLIGAAQHATSMIGPFHL